MAQTATLGWIDFFVIFLMLGVSSSIGIYYRLTGGRQKTTQEYYTANRSMGVFPIGMALMVSFMSAITLLGVSSENYIFGTQFVVINISYIIGTPIVCYFYMPVFFKLQATSAYEYLEKRFGMSARLTASFIYWIQLLLYSGVVLYAPALALEATTGLSKNLSIVLIGVVCTFYSTVGGIKAVLITDLFQGFLMFFAVLVVIGTAAYSVGGISEIWNIAQEGGRIQFDSISLDPTVRHTYWSLIIGGLFTFLSLYGVNQVQVQRLMTVRKIKSARLALWLSLPILMCLSVLTCFSGLAMYTKYRRCDPVKEGRINLPDMLLPLYVMDTLSHLPGVPGFFIAGIFSAGLSTISAALNSLSAVSLEDYIKPLYRKFTKNELPDSRSLVIGKLLAVIFGILSIALAFLAQYLGGVLQASLTIFGVVGGPLLAIFTLGMISQMATQRGAVIGTLISLIFSFWMAFGQPRPRALTLPVYTDGCDAQNLLTPTNTTLLNRADNSSFFYLYRISYMWYCPIGFVIAIVIGFFISFVENMVSGRKEEYKDPNLFFPMVAKRLRRKQRKLYPNIMTQKDNIQIDSSSHSDRSSTIL
ncbi:putative sodium-dependent multivitamin transporter [Leptopilina heterotoma]|uniref:putative sodium-dependent multivitamin transporter n=1 Tax=Leptopilina heterotoma TaxID=63436 RepID=UPI001CA8A63B|nr:putative sodium-dependent multivitamin transporter [Leptopilina heterotoma]XP_043479819.1 putative sodium-dependent multivitamin transporter [Leptopilina heterotoma]XP_043479820.1 putative sodium-dependent multivitamin transporter [Leptopilina heterotoma]XP_043479821.1 putative sodium-dependent multivitamin transporter [Leptopilina heterotoma]